MVVVVVVVFILGGLDLSQEATIPFTRFVCGCVGVWGCFVPRSHGCLWLCVVTPFSVRCRPRQLRQARSLIWKARAASWWRRVHNPQRCTVLGKNEFNNDCSSCYSLTPHPPTQTPFLLLLLLLRILQAYETSVALDTEISDELPFNDYYEYYGPDFRLHITYVHIVWPAADAVVWAGMVGSGVVAFVVRT